jgi:predicted transglutaminase-like protease
MSVNGRKVREHRWIMEQVVGRDLTSDENVHHIDGNRSNNTLENLELWTTKQPKGQRVSDKIAYSLEILQRYAPQLLAKDSRKPPKDLNSK